MMLSVQQRKVLFIFVFYSILGYLLDGMMQPTWMHSYNQTMRITAWLIPSYGVAALMLYYLNKNLKGSSMAMRLFVSVAVMILFQCLVEYGKSVLTDTFQTAGECITVDRLIMFSVIVVAFAYGNKALLRAVFGSSSA